MLLGANTIYKNKYDKNLLYPITRKNKRNELNIDSQNLPFCGADIWNMYELSWLNHNNKPQIALAEIIIPADSENIIESKSLKLYFNSFNNTNFTNVKEVHDIVECDLSAAVNSPVKINIKDVNSTITVKKAEGICLDDIDLKLKEFKYCPEILSNSNNNLVTENLYSNLFKSNCLVTNQPDWATIIIEYNGYQIDHHHLLHYLISFRNHNEFHEQCIERIFCDISKNCKLDWLTVYGRFTRRGGIDINPIRSNNPNFILPENNRLIRQ